MSALHPMQRNRSDNAPYNHGTLSSHRCRISDRLFPRRRQHSKPKEALSRGLTVAPMEIDKICGRNNPHSDSPCDAYSAAIRISIIREAYPNGWGHHEHVDEHCTNSTPNRAISLHLRFAQQCNYPLLSKAFAGGCLKKADIRLHMRRARAQPGVDEMVQKVKALLYWISGSRRSGAATLRKPYSGHGFRLH